MNIAIIPARMGSTRFPGKPLVEILGKPMVRWVLDAVGESGVDKAFVASDSQRILACISPDQRILTGDCRTGTDRVWQACGIIGCGEGDIILNIQGDEPCIKGRLVDTLLNTVKEGHSIATLCRRVDFGQAVDMGTVKVVRDYMHDALYFSRYAIPHGGDTFLAHIGVYGYTYSALSEFAGMMAGDLERDESIEPLRLIEDGKKIQVREVEYDGVGVDYPKDIDKAKQVLMTRYSVDGLQC